MHEMRTQQGNNPQKETSKEQADTRLLKNREGVWLEQGGSRVGWP
jgi:hypothetical protein